MKGNILNFTAETAVTAFRFVKAGEAQGNVKLAGSGDAVLGVSMDVDVKEGNRVDVQHDGIGHVELGADVTYGQALSSDAEGRGVPAEGVSGIVALDSGSEGDVVRIKVDCAGSSATASTGDETPSEPTEPEGGETPSTGDDTPASGNDTPTNTESGDTTTGDETPTEPTEPETSGTEGGETPTEPTEPENSNEGA